MPAGDSLVERDDMPPPTPHDHDRTDTICRCSHVVCPCQREQLRLLLSDAIHNLYDADFNIAAGRWMVVSRTQQRVAVGSAVTAALPLPPLRRTDQSRAEENEWNLVVGATLAACSDSLGLLWARVERSSHGCRPLCRLTVPSILPCVRAAAHPCTTSVRMPGMHAVWCDGPRVGVPPLFALAAEGG